MLLCHTVGWIHLSIGKPGRWLRWSLFHLAVTGTLFVLALKWGPEGVAAAWSISFWMLLIPAFWYAGRPVGFSVSDLIRAIWRYAAGGLAAGLTTAALLRSTPVWHSYSGAGPALEATVVISALFIALYLGAVILFHWGIGPLRQLASLLRELAPAPKDTTPSVQALEAYN